MVNSWCSYLSDSFLCFYKAVYSLQKFGILIRGVCVCVCLYVYTHTHTHTHTIEKAFPESTSELYCLLHILHEVDAMQCSYCVYLYFCMKL